MRTALVLVMAVLLMACGDASPETDEGDVSSLEGELLISAAASLTDVFSDIAEEFETRHPDVAVRLNVAASSSLREQILQGAPADVFAPADEHNMEMVLADGQVVGEPALFARNSLLIAVPAGNPGGVATLHDFARDDLLIGLCAVSVPCGDLARMALAGVGVIPAVDTDEPDVRALLTKLEAGELDAGIIYVTDSRPGAGLVEGIEIPAESNVSTAYPIATLSSGRNRAAALAFVEFVLSPSGQAILAEYGFSPP